MPEEGFSFFEIQTPWEISPPQTKRSPLNPANFDTAFVVQTQYGQLPLHHLGRGSKLWRNTVNSQILVNG